MNNDYLKMLMESKIKSVIANWVTLDIYAVSLFVQDFCDNPCEPTVTLGYNTEQQYKKTIAIASCEEEARWNYAFWLQNHELVFGQNETRGVVEKWIASNGLPYFPCVDYDFDIPDDTDDKLLSQITNNFVDTLIDVVKNLHESGFIKDKFSKEIPIIIHELEYYNKIAEQNIKANTLPIVNDFVNFIRQLNS